jgi:hypothetical protein
MDALLTDPALLKPALALVCWTLVMWLWMYATRIPAMLKSGVDPATIKRPADLDVLPMSVKQIADNYNHLHEQPTIFYALVLVAQLAGTATDFTVVCAWLYVGARIAHSLFQALVNFVPVRFALFALGSLPLFAIAGEQALALFG